MSSELLRLFIAIELSDALRAELSKLQEQFQDVCRARNVSPRALRRVAPKNIHLTLKFLGNVERTRIPALEAALASATKNIAPFELHLHKLGCFPNALRPNNVWVGLEGDLEPAARLAAQIQLECAASGFARDERGFTPHLTLARVPRDIPNATRAAVGEIAKNSYFPVRGTIRADAVDLIASNLQPTGPIYTFLAHIQLGKD